MKRINVIEIIFRESVKERADVVTFLDVDYAVGSGCLFVQFKDACYTYPLDTINRIKVK